MQHWWGCSRGCPWFLGASVLSGEEMETSSTDLGCAACGAAHVECFPCVHPGLRLLCSLPGWDTGNVRSLFVMAELFLVVSWCHYEMHWDWLASLNRRVSDLCPTVLQTELTFSIPGVESFSTG